MATMLDALQGLAELSVELQKRMLNIVDSDRAVSRQIEVFQAIVESGGSYFKEASKAVEEGSFNGVQLHQASKNTPTINPRQLYRSLAGHIKIDLLCVSHPLHHPSNRRLMKTPVTAPT